METLVDYIWSEASGELSSLLSESIKSEDVCKAEGFLLSIRRVLSSESSSTRDGTAELNRLTADFYSCIPHTDQSDIINTKLKLARKQDLCQVG